MHEVVSLVVFAVRRVQIAAPVAERLLVRADGLQHDLATHSQHVHKNNGDNCKLCDAKQKVTIKMGERFGGLAAEVWGLAAFTRTAVTTRER